MTRTLSPNDTDSLHPADILINVIVTLLAPMFLTSGDGNIALARMAALETIRCYCVHNHASLIKVGNIIAFGLATLGSLSLSMTDELGIPLVLRLHANANALDRSCNRNERALQALGRQQAAQPADPGFDITAAGARVAEAQQPAAEVPAMTQAPAAGAEPVAPSRGQEIAKPPGQTLPAARIESSGRSQWAAAMAQVAAEDINAAALSPNRRHAGSARAEILGSTANTLLCGGPGAGPVPGAPFRLTAAGTR